MSQSKHIATRTKYKFVILGDEAVGKTSILTRFMYDHFDDVHDATVGIDFLSKTMYLNDRVLRLQLWDTAGQERFRSLIPSYIRDSSVAIVTYDITNRQSFNHVDYWITNIHEERGDDVIIMLVGNKIDLKNRQIAKNEGQEKANELGTLFIETSAKRGDNIKEIFTTIAAKLPDIKPNSQTKEIIITQKPPTQPTTYSCLCSGSTK